MSGGDVAAVAALEARFFSSWSRQQVASELQRDTGIAFVAMSADGNVMAWCCGMLVGGDAELLKIAVHPDVQKQGVGWALLGAFCRFCEKKEIEQVFLEVRAENYPALQLYKKHGFFESGKRRNYYKDPVDDAVICVCRFPRDTV